MRAFFPRGLRAFASARFDPFDLYIGVSPGACHLASHLAGQCDRNWRLPCVIPCPPGSSTRRFLRGGHLMDLDWMWEQTIRHDQLDLTALFETALPTATKGNIHLATSMETGKALYQAPGRTRSSISSKFPALFQFRLPQGSGGPGRRRPMAAWWMPFRREAPHRRGQPTLPLSGPGRWVT